MHIQELAKQLGAAVDPAADVDLTGVATIEEAGPGDVTFLANPRYAGRLRTCNAGAVFVTPGLEEEVSPVRLAIDNPYLAFAKAIALFHAPPATDPGVHPTAVLGEGVTLGVDVSIGAYVVLGKDVEVGDRTVIHPHCTVYEGARIGANCLLHSHTVVREHVRLGDGVILQNGAVVGSDGFGFAPRADKSLHKIPQAGTVELADEVEVQANACIDRATIGRTTVGRGTKIDNLVQIGHGCHVGEDSLLCGQVGLAGSTDIGNRVTLAGQAGIAGHCSIADDVVVGAQSGVGNTLKEAGTYLGSPAVPIELCRKIYFYWSKLPQFSKRLKTVERRLADAAEREDQPQAE